MAILSRLGPQAAAAIVFSLRRFLPGAMLAAAVLLCASVLLTVAAREASRRGRSNIVATESLRRTVPENALPSDPIDRDQLRDQLRDWNGFALPAASSSAEPGLVVPATFQSPTVFSAPTYSSPVRSPTFSELVPLERFDPFADPARPAPSTFERQ